MNQSQQLLDLMGPREGHFLLESGHHGALWLDLPQLCLQPKRLRPFIEQLAERLRPLDVDVVCGPLIEGALVAFPVAEILGVKFMYTERSPNRRKGLFPVDYRLPQSQRSLVANRRVAVVNDVINAGSAIRGTYGDLVRCNSEILAIGALLVLGESAYQFAEKNKVKLEALVSIPNELWLPDACPKCAEGLPLEDLA